jgi:hypothetical protein
VERYYFHLVDGHDIIPDDVGVNVADLAEACAETIEAVYEFRQDHAATEADWTDWQVEVADASGAIVLHHRDLTCPQGRKSAIRITRIRCCAMKRFSRPRAAARPA